MARRSLRGAPVHSPIPWCDMYCAQNWALCRTEMLKLLPMGEAALTFPALEKGIVEAASLTMPFNLIAKKMGFRELVDYDRAGVVYPYNTVTTLRQTPAKNLELTEKLLKSMIEGIHVFKTNKQRTVAVFEEVHARCGR